MGKVLYSDGFEASLVTGYEGGVLAYPSKIFNFSICMISVTEAGAETSVIIA